MIDFGGDKAPIPPSCLVSIYAKNNDPDTVPMLNYSVPLEGVSEAMEIFINRSLRNFSGKLGMTWPSMLYHYYNNRCNSNCSSYLYSCQA